MPTARALLWLLRALWAILPFTVGSGLADALDGSSDPVRLVATLGLWALWFAGLAVSLVPTTVSLTALRTLAPAPAAAAAAALATAPGAVTAAGLAAAAVTGAVAFRGEIGRIFAEGSAYGDEARFPLRAPGPLLVGPLPLMWAVMASCCGAGPLLLAAKVWTAGVAVSIVGVALVLVLPRRFHQLSRRFLVFVPAGLALHDHLVLAETAMFRWRAVERFERALSGTGALDLTAGALGPAIELGLVDMDTIVRLGDRPGRSETVHVRSMLCAPTLTAAALREAARRRPA